MIDKRVPMASFGVIRDRHRGRALEGAALHDDMTPSAPNLNESVLL
jgi:hypothetical protein